jgi:hypothetical protein
LPIILGKIIRYPDIYARWPDGSKGISPPFKKNLDGELMVINSDDFHLIFSVVCHRVDFSNPARKSVFPN